MTRLTEDDITLAGEYVLGLLDAAQEAAATARIAVEPAFAAEVEAWRIRLMPMLGSEQAPPPHIWTNIESALPAATGQDLGTRQLTFWRAISGISVTAAIFMAVLLLQKPEAAPQLVPQTPMVAALGSETGNSAITAQYDGRQGTMLLTPVALDTGKLYPELWVIPEDGKARSLGMIDAKGPSQMSVTPQMRQYIHEGAMLAITPEPARGAPGGVATGPILASGKINIL